MGKKFISLSAVTLFAFTLTVVGCGKKEEPAPPPPAPAAPAEPATPAAPAGDQKAGEPMNDTSRAPAAPEKRDDTKEKNWQSEPEPQTPGRPPVRD